ncbi:MAG: hypothetical protein MUF07_17695 [Steroidobacteraceae bacterium]|jgi:hypothetical protein|nr:hypothetical protein [Steroidobacteraceae bacterium]
MTTPSALRPDPTAASTPGPVAAAFLAPWLGPLAFVTVLLWKPLAHTLAVLLHRHLPGSAGYLAGFAIGLAGAMLVWRGLRREEHAATCLGLAGGLLIWIGWMEYAFVYFAETMRIPWVTLPDGTPALPPQFVLMQGTTVPVLLILYLTLVANRDTGCRAALWLRRRLHLNPGAPSPAQRPAYARITALEVIFVNWFMYLVLVTLNDPRVFGRTHPIQYAAFATFVLWAGYCLVARMPRITALPLALRYGVGVVGPAWAAIEIGSYKGFWTEVWIKPAQYPVTVTAIALSFAALAALVYRQPATSQQAARGPATPSNA